MNPNIELGTPYINLCGELTDVSAFSYLSRDMMVTETNQQTGIGRCDLPRFIACPFKIS